MDPPVPTDESNVFVKAAAPSCMIPASYTGSAENEYCDVSCGVYLTLIAFAEGTVVFVKETMFG
jgi:hypothetical protein